jgi:hypothetical protein
VPKNIKGFKMNNLLNQDCIPKQIQAEKQMQEFAMAVINDHQIMSKLFKSEASIEIKDKKLASVSN